MYVLRHSWRLCFKLGSSGLWRRIVLYLHAKLHYITLHGVTTQKISTSLISIYESRLKNSWTHHITSSRNFVEVRWRSLFRSTFLGKRCTSPTLHPLLENVLQTVCRKLQEEPQSSLFMVGNAQKSHGMRSGLYGGCSNGVPPIHVFQTEHRIQSRNADSPLSKLLVAPPS
jgi:hypothetical protein